MSEAREELGYRHENITDQFNCCESQEEMYVNENYLSLYSHCLPRHKAAFDDAMDFRLITQYLEKIIKGQTSEY
jgi:hypothetical protein